MLADNAGNYHKGIGLVQAKRAIGDGLLTSDGPLWRKQRKMIQPVFQAKRIAQQAGVIAAETGQLVERLQRHAGARPGRHHPGDDRTHPRGAGPGVAGRRPVRLRRRRALVRGRPGPGDVRDGDAGHGAHVGAAAQAVALPQGAGEPRTGRRRAGGRPAGARQRRRRRDVTADRLDRAGGRPRGGPAADARRAGHPAAGRARDHREHPELDVLPARQASERSGNGCTTRPSRCWATGRRSSRTCTG